MFRDPHAASGARLALHWRRFDEAEVDLCLRLSRVRRGSPIDGLFRVVS
jgi:hypothetical protein